MRCPSGGSSRPKTMLPARIASFTTQSVPREAGDSWLSIGMAFRVTKQAAQKRFGR